MPPSQLNRGLVTFGTRITEEGFVGTRVLAQPSSQLRLLGCIIQVGDVMQFGHLGGDSLGQFGVGMA
jgi:hypothetical protein